MRRVSPKRAHAAACRRMELFDAMPRQYRDLANEVGLDRARMQMLDDEEIAAFERDHSSTSR